MSWRDAYPVPYGAEVEEMLAAGFRMVAAMWDTIYWTDKELPPDFKFTELLFRGGRDVITNLVLCVDLQQRRIYLRFDYHGAPVEIFHVQ